MCWILTALSMTGAMRVGAETIERYPIQSTATIWRECIVSIHHSLLQLPGLPHRLEQLQPEIVVAKSLSITRTGNTLEFENGTYHSQIITSYQLNTGWLNDQQSENLAFNLLSSNEVYLHNLCSDKVYPVVITDNTATYKTYKNNSRKFVNYQINCEESQRKEVL